MDSSRFREFSGCVTIKTKMINLANASVMYKKAKPSERVRSFERKIYFSRPYYLFMVWLATGGTVTNMFATKEVGLRIKEVQLDWGKNQGGEESTQ